MKIKKILALLLVVLMAVNQIAPVAYAVGAEDPYTCSCEDRSGSTLLKTYAATCLVEAYKLYECHDCGKQYTEYVGPALGHIEVIDPAVAPTCTETGLTEGKHCDVCDEVIVAQEVIEANGHTPDGRWQIGHIIPANCTEEGSYTEYMLCVVCGEVAVENVVTTPAFGHTEVNHDEVLADCENAGHSAYISCEKCDWTEGYVEYPALGHSSLDPVLEGQGYCHEGNLYWVTYCETCGDELSREVVSAKHAYYTPDHKEADCVNPEMDVYNCYICGYVWNNTFGEALGHSYDAVVTDPTCTEQGYTTYTCSVCGDTYVDDYVSELGHDYVGVDTAPTCTEQGYTTYTCSVCGDSYVADYVDPTGHEYEQEGYKPEVIAPDCIHEGYDLYSCSWCGDSYKDNFTNPDPSLHDIQITIPYKAPTCSAEGNEAEFGCTICGEQKSGGEVIAINPDAHKYEAVVTAPTCTEQGYTTHTCVHNDEHQYVDAYVDALGHSPAPAVEENRVEATCTEAGSYEMVVYCSVCDEELARDSFVIDALGHDKIVHEAQAPTCTEIGWNAYVTCSRCDYTTYEENELAALGHEMHPTYGRTDPTCTSDAYDIWECARCDYEEIIYEEGTMLPHTEVVDAGYAETCTEAGLTDGAHCEVCGTVTVAQEEIPAHGHTEGAAVEENRVEPDCVNAGSYDSVVYCVCADCDCKIELSRVEVAIDALGHSYDAVVTDPTCTEQGYTTYTCSVCGDSYVDNYVDANGHSYDAVVTDPTCTEQGYTTYTCSVCGDSYVDNYVDANGHSYDAVVTDPNCTEQGYTTNTCSVCGDSYVDAYVDALGHDLEIWEAVEPTWDETGLTAGEKCLREGCDHLIEQQIVDRLSEEIEFTYEATGINGSENAVNSGYITLNVYMNVLTEQARVWGADMGISFDGSKTPLLNVEGYTFLNCTVSDYNGANYVMMTFDMDANSAETFAEGKYLVATLTFAVDNSVYNESVSFDVIGEVCDVSRNSTILNTLYFDFGAGTSIYVNMVGDANGDGKITTQDNMLLHEWMTSDIENEDYNYIFDMNKDGYIDLADQAAIRDAIVGIYDVI